MAPRLASIGRSLATEIDQAPDLGLLTRTRRATSMDDVVETGEAAMKRWEESRDCVLQASGMVSVQAGRLLWHARCDSDRRVHARSPEYRFTVGNRPE